MTHSDGDAGAVLSHRADGTPPTGSRALDVSNLVARLHKHYIGRGPTNVRTSIDGDLVVVLLEGGYTQAEQTLEANDRADLVSAGRLGLQEAMKEALVRGIRDVLEREVVSFMSANDLDRNLSVEVFVLAPDDGVSGSGMTGVSGNDG